MKQTGLFSWHCSHSAKMTVFAGWEMPIHYAMGAKAEHRMVRRSCGLFDVSHMGRFLLQCNSEKARREYEFLLSSMVETLPICTGKYGLLCTEDGGILDDVYNFRLNKNTYLIVLNAINREKVFGWLQSWCPNIHIEDITLETGMIALQGPQSFQLLRNSGFEKKLHAVFRKNAISTGSILSDGIFTRTGYTGEDGVEIYAPNSEILKIWNTLLEHSTKDTIDSTRAATGVAIECAAIGLAARDSLRFEASYALYGNELNENISPIEAGLKWACKIDADAPDFLGKTAIIDRAQHNTFKIRSLKMIDAGVPRQGMKVYNGGEKEVGYICSGMYCPTLKGFYANAYVDKALHVADRIYLNIRENLKSAEIVARPLYRLQVENS